MTQISARLRAETNVLMPRVVGQSYTLGGSHVKSYRMFALTIGATMASAVLVTAQQNSPGTESGTNPSAPAKVTYIGCLSPGSGENRTC